MYSDPSQIRDNPVRVNLTQDEKAIVQAAADKCGLQVAQWCRMVVVEQVKARLLRNGIKF